MSTCVWTTSVIGWFLEEHWTAYMEIPAECLNSCFITGSCWLAFVQKNQFLFPRPSLLSAFISLAVWKGWAGSGCLRQQGCSKCRVSQAETRGTVKLWTHLQEANGASRWICYIAPLDTLSLYGCESACLTGRLSASVPCMWRSVLSHFLLFTFSHSPSLPLSVSHCLSRPYSLIVSLYLALLQPLR